MTKYSWHRKKTDEEEPNWAIFYFKFIPSVCYALKIKKNKIEHGHRQNTAIIGILLKNL